MTHNQETCASFWYKFLVLDSWAYVTPIIPC